MTQAQEHTKFVIRGLKRQKREAEEKLHNIETAILSIQKVCDHDFTNVGHDHNNEYEECNICGAVRRV